MRTTDEKKRLTARAQTVTAKPAAISASATTCKGSGTSLV
jgi:hypothetical protein